MLQVEVREVAKVKGQEWAQEWTLELQQQLVEPYWTPSTTPLAALTRVVTVELAQGQEIGLVVPCHVEQQEEQQEVKPAH